MALLSSNHHVLCIHTFPSKDGYTCRAIAKAELVRGLQTFAITAVLPGFVYSPLDLTAAPLPRHSNVATYHNYFLSDPEKLSSHAQSNCLVVWRTTLIQCPLKTGCTLVYCSPLDIGTCLEFYQTRMPVASWSLCHDAHGRKLPDVHACSSRVSLVKRKLRLFPGC